MSSIGGWNIKLLTIKIINIIKSIIFFAIFLFICSCSDELITVVDEYNPPYEIKAIPGNNSISVSFWSGVLASDFAGFNIYAGTSSSFNQPTDAILNSDGGYPTIAGSNHTRSNFTLTIPQGTSGGYQNGTLYYVTVTAYGTNDLISEGYIETRINSVVPVIPRVEGDGSGTAITVNGNAVGTIDTSAGLVRASAGWSVQYFGYQTDFNSVVVVTNMNGFDSEAVYSVNGLYIFSNNSALAKVWITGANSYRWAYQGNASAWNGV